jgi:septum formation protein
MVTVKRHSPNAQPLTLASASPRRRELLAYLVSDFSALATSGEDEDRYMPPELAARLPEAPVPPMFHPTLLAWRKVTAARAAGVDGIVLGADTIVVVDGTVLNKPRDAAEAHAMLRQLAGRAHHVYTGLFADAVAGPALGLAVAEVHMRPQTDAAIAAYVRTGEPMDKAGAYGIQGRGGAFVAQVVGSYTCVVGLPLGLTHDILAAVGLTGLADPVAAFERWLADTGKGTPACTAP